MSERLSLKKLNGANPAWLVLPLVVFALITLTVGLVARQTVRTPYSTPFFDLFFSDTLHMKAWLVTAAVILACSQLLTAARIYEVLRFPPKGRLYHSVHRWSGRAAILLTLPAAYHCVFLLGFGTHSPRVLIHSLLGLALYGAVVAKVLIVRSRRFAHWVLPVAGGLLFSILLGLWLTSALVFFTAGLARPARSGVARQQLAVHTERPMELAGDSQRPRSREGHVHLYLALGRDVGVDAERRNADVVQRARLVLHAQGQLLPGPASQERRRKEVVVGRQL